MNAPNLPAGHAERMERVRLCLDGLSVGDAFGERFFRTDVLEVVERREVPSPPWYYTDDTVMALGIAEVLGLYGRIEQDELARVFAERYAAQPDRGYGPGARNVLGAIGGGLPWRTVSGAVFNGQGSLGNGSAMRVGPVGAYFAGEPEAVVENARLSAEVTHAHSEGAAGAIAAAVAAATAWGLRDSAGPDVGSQILGAAIANTSHSQVRAGLEQAAEIPLESDVSEAAMRLGNGSRVTCPDTVPFCVWCAAKFLRDYQAAMWATVSVLGDIDTNCAIVGAIVAGAAGREGIPADWIAAREELNM